MAGWLDGCMVGLVGRVIGWLASTWLDGCMVGWLDGRMVG
jgi:hypothetical protein